MAPSKTTANKTNVAHSVLCVFMALVLSIGLMPPVPQAYAADGEKADSVTMQVGNQANKLDVAKQVANLDANMGKGATISFDIKDKYNNLAAGDKQRQLVAEDASGKQTKLKEATGDKVEIKSDQLVAGQKLKLITSTKEKNGTLAKRYEQQLNVRVIDTKKAEQKPSAGSDGAAAGMSENGSTWSFTNGLEVKIQNTGFKFLDGTTINLGGMMLPLKYKHETDGTTIVGINCDPNNVAFYKAVKNGNVWQKYTTEKMADMTKQMDKGWSGKGFGKWGGKAFDWNVMGFMEYNTKDPNAPRALNLIISLGMKAEGHAQYLCFTGTLTFTIGGKATLVGKMTPAKGVEGKFGLGGYGGLELYVGLGLNYVASVGAFGKGQINVDFQVLPKFFLDTIKVSGAFGVKAKAFGFTLFTWNILSGEKQLYPKGSNAKKAPPLNQDGTATSPYSVSADTVYPSDSREYLNRQNAFTSGQNDIFSPQESASSSTIAPDIYGETELSCTTTSSGPVIAYVADAKQADPSLPDRGDANRSVIVYKRMKSDGTWTAPRVIDAEDRNADYTPTISSNGDECYISWLSSKNAVTEHDSIGEVGKKLDVKVATISKASSGEITDDQVKVYTVNAESEDPTTMPASPEATKVGNNLYVGWYTNQTNGSNGEVIGMNGTHNVRLYSHDVTSEGGTWTPSAQATTEPGAITSFDVGAYSSSTPACAWSLDAGFNRGDEEVSLNGVDMVARSKVYSLAAGGQPAIIADKAASAQFAKYNGADVLTYAKQTNSGDSLNSNLSIMSVASPTGTGNTVLDGSKVNLPTPSYEIAGDIGSKRGGNVSFLAAGDGTSDIQALVTTGGGAADWTSVVEATADTATIADYCATYRNGLPLFIYTTERASSTSDGDVTGQAEDDGSVDLNQTTAESLKHLRVTDVDYDEYEVSTGEKMPILVYFDNDGMDSVSGADLWMLENGIVTKVATSNTAVDLDGDGIAAFDYTVPPRDTFTKAREFTVYATPKDAPQPSPEKIMREKNNGAAMTVSFGAPSLSLNTDHQIVDDQESIVSTVKNDGVVPQGAKLVYLDSETGDELRSVDVAALGENETFTDKFDAPHEYFQNDGVNNIVITLENDGSESGEGYEINNTEFVSAWEVYADEDGSDVAENTGASENTTKGAPANASAPSTGDQIMKAMILLLFLLAAIAAVVVVRAARKARNR